MLFVCLSGRERAEEQQTVSQCQSPPTLDVIDATNSQLINKSIKPTYLVKQHKAKTMARMNRGGKGPLKS